MRQQLFERRARVGELLGGSGDSGGDHHPTLNIIFGRVYAVDRDHQPDTLNRVSHMFVEALGRMFRTRLPRAFLKGATPFIGTQWKAVTRSFCQFAVHHPSAERFKTFYRRSFIPDEAFFQTLMMNSANQGEMMNDDLRTIDWVPDGEIKLRPRTFVAANALRLTLSPDLFARKFDAEEDDVIFDLLEAHLKTPAGNVFAGDPATPPPKPALEVA